MPILYSNKAAVRKWREFEIKRRGGLICDVCKQKVHRLVVDHDHRTGIVRGLVCGPCNTGIGCFQDSQAIAKSAAAYLERAHEATLAWLKSLPPELDPLGVPSWLVQRTRLMSKDEADDYFYA